MIKTKKSFALVSVLMIVLTVTAIFAFMPHIHAQEPEEPEGPYVDFEIPFSMSIAIHTGAWSSNLPTSLLFNFTIEGHENAQGVPLDPAQVDTSGYLDAMSIFLPEDMEHSGSLFKSAFPPIRYTAPGRYYYDIHQDDYNYLNSKFDRSTYTVCVEVSNNDEGGLSASLIAIYKDPYGQYDTATKRSGINFENHLYDYGSLTLSKTVTGELGDRNKEFRFYVEFDTELYSFDAGEKGQIGVGKGYITLKHGESITFTNVPAFTDFTITEILESDSPYKITVEYDGFVQKRAIVYGSIVPHITKTVAYTNDLPYTPVVGLNMDVLPFVLIGIISLGGVAFIIYKKRSRASAM